MTYTIIDPTAADYRQALENEERKSEQVKQRLLDLEEAVWRLCCEYRSIPVKVTREAKECPNTRSTIEALRQLAKQINFPEWYKL